MRDADPVITAITFHLATSLGWKRRSDLGPRAWEMPDGRVFDHTGDSVPQLMTFDWR